MPKFVIERNIPGVGKLNNDQVKDVARQSCAVLMDMGPKIQWVHSYRTDDKLYCVYVAPNAEMVREHARLGGFPADTISVVHSIMEPITAE